MKKLIKITSGCLFFMFFLFLLNRALTYLFVDNVNSQSRITLHELYTSEENIDILFLGSSHCMRTFNCDIGDKLLSLNTFNCGTSSQFLDGSYAMLVEAGKDNSLKEVWVELYYGQLGRVTQERTEMTATYILSDYMPLSFNKLRFLLLASSPEYYANSFIPVRRSWEKVFTDGYFINLMNAKFSDAYKNYEYIGSYLGKGFIGSDTYIEPGSYVHTNDFWSIEPLTNDDKENLQNIMRYCEQNNIELHFFSAPMSDFRLVTLSNYDQYVSEISAYLAQYGYEYYDFNLCKAEYLSLDETDYIDDNHLNKQGADKVTTLICDIINSDVNVDTIFELDYKTKINYQEPQIYGVQLYTTLPDAENTLYEIVPIANTANDYLYTISKTDSSGKTTKIQEANYNNLFYIPNNEKGTIYIDVIVNGNVTNHVKTTYGTEK